MRHSPSSPVEHLFTIDVEEYFQVNAFEGLVARADWERQPSRVARAVDRLLELLARHGMQGTFFTLGWIAKHHPGVVRDIAAAGHEIASHGWWHRRVPTLTPAEFRIDVRDARRILEDVGGQPVTGYRAPSFSILPGFEWAFEILVEEGYRYDSSVFPIRRRGYGWPDAPTEPYRIACAAGELLEIPMTILSIGGLRLPAAGGGWFRHFPYGVVAAAFGQAERAARPGIFYLHPWEVDPGQPQLPVSWLTRQRHYRGLDSTFGRLERLLTDYRFTSVRRALERGALGPLASMAA